MPTTMSRKNTRIDHIGPQAQAYAKNRARVLYTQDICALCGRPVDKSLKYPNPMSATVDHIIPLSKGGHPSDMGNLQLTHWICNRVKSDKTITDMNLYKNSVKDNNKKIYQSRDWKNLKV